MDDRLMRHGGEQLIRVDETNIPLTVKHGLLGLDITHPTEEEMESLTILWLTGDTMWDPSSLDVEDEEVFSPGEPDYGGVVKQLNAISDFQKTFPSIG